MRKFTSTHEWVETREGKAYVGISAHAAEELGEIVYVDLPEPGTAVSAGKPFCELESVKAVAEVNSPVDGVIVEVNSELNDAPEKAGEDGVWICAVQATAEAEGLMSEDEYLAYLG